MRRDGALRDVAAPIGLRAAPESGARPKGGGRAVDTGQGAQGARVQTGRSREITHTRRLRVPARVPCSRLPSP
eukprot:3365260-Prymnesium_polylepis.1